MKALTLSLITLALVSIGLDANAQDPHFTQYYANPLYLNPALAGSSKCPRATLNYRNQYPALSGVYQTYSASYDQYAEKLNGGVGLLVMRDNAGNGALTATEISGIYSYHLEVTRKFAVLAGFQATVRQRAMDFNNFTFPDQIEPFYGFVRTTQEVPPGDEVNTHFDVSAGIIGFTEKFYFGFAAHHLTQPDESFYEESKLPMKLTAHAGFTIPLGKQRLHNELQNYLIPNIVYQMQGPYDQLTISASFNRGPLFGGLGLRTSTVNTDAVVILLGYEPTDYSWKIGYSYDITVSKLANDLGGAHEISLSYQFPCRTPKKKIQAINCPKF